jgi:Uma2 family endonuclease
MAMSVELESLLRSPRLLEYLQELNRRAETEALARQKFFDDVSPNQKAEFINGEVVMHSPVRLKHNTACLKLSHLLDAYVSRHHLGHVGIEKLLVSLTRNDYEPDIAFWGIEKSKGFAADQMKFPAPDLVVEVLSESTEANDRGVKLLDYAQHRVSEYLIIDPDAESVEQYVISGHDRAIPKYEMTMKSSTGIFISTAVSGFRIDVRAIFDRDLHARTLAEILSS